MQVTFVKIIVRLGPAVVTREVVPLPASAGMLYQLTLVGSRVWFRL